MVIADDLFASFSGMLNLVSGVCLGVKLPISPLVGEIGCLRRLRLFLWRSPSRMARGKSSKFQFPGNRMIRLESIS
ncbi:hypothetical protein, partial [Mesorhizobium carmichaelinearum]|uniref:hypothetical protein n=1 Tax=Mesorhizobium carmichaelinearum TaxID=1208188 RepID=UPI00117EF349